MSRMHCLFSDYSVLSNFTWNLFEDSGWYRVNFTFTETAVEQFDLQWGRGLLLCNLQLTNILHTIKQYCRMDCLLIMHPHFDALLI